MQVVPEQMIVDGSTVLSVFQQADGPLRLGIQWLALIKLKTVVLLLSEGMVQLLNISEEVSAQMAEQECMLVLGVAVAQEPQGVLSQLNI